MAVIDNLMLDFGMLKVGMDNERIQNTLFRWDSSLRDSKSMG